MNSETEEVEEQVYSEVETFNFKVSMIMEFEDGAALEANYYRGIDAESVTEARALFLDQFNSLTISQLIEEAKERIAKEPNNLNFYRALARLYAQNKRYEEAVATIESALERGFGDVYDYLYFFPFLNNTRDHFYDKLRDDPRFIEILRREERKYADNLEKYGGL